MDLHVARWRLMLVIILYMHLLWRWKSSTVYDTARLFRFVRTHGSCLRHPASMRVRCCASLCEYTYWQSWLSLYRTLLVLIWSKNSLIIIESHSSLRGAKYCFINFYLPTIIISLNLATIVTSISVNFFRYLVVFIVFLSWYCMGVYVLFCLQKRR